jgi:thiamine biosynthesis lipoprotein ApbE
LICCAGLSSLLAACQTPPATDQPSPAPVQRSRPLLGTFITITAFCSDESATQTTITAAFEEIERVDLLLSIHKTNSETALLNSAAASQPQKISPELHFVLTNALSIARRTDGAFDPTIAPLAQLWGFIWKEYRFPTAEELQRVLPLVDFRKVLVSTNGTVSFQSPDMSLDFGGIGKGYAVDRAIHVLQEHRITNAMVKAGGDLRVIGAPPGKNGWEVQIEDPARQGKRATILLREGALSTSGNYENFFEIDGKRYSHIIDPRTGLPVQGVVSCTVIAPTCLESDAYATAFFVLGIDRSFRKFGEQFGVRFVDADGQVRLSESFPGVR